MKTIIAIDPGLSGGIACLRAGQPVLAVPMPATEGDLIALLRELAPDPDQTTAYLEAVTGYVGVAQPGSSAFRFGRNFGFLLGVLQTLGIRLELIRPQRWQKPLGLGTASACASKTEWKNKLKGLAQRLYPRLKVTLATADAVLILDYALRLADGGHGQSAHLAHVSGGGHLREGKNAGPPLTACSAETSEE